MPPKIQVWTSEKENILIYEVERRPMLWDASCEAYKRTDLKYNQWYQIAEILGSSFNADMVQHRFTNMRQTFMANFRKERESKNRCSGKSPEEIYKCKWVLYDRLKFLKKSSVQAESLSNLQTSLNTPYSDKTESLTDNIVTKETTKSFENIEYVENEDIDTMQFHLYNSQETYIPTDAPENKIYNNSDVLSCSSATSNFSSSLSSYDSQSSSFDSSNVAKLPATVHSSASLKSTSSKFSHDKENIYVKRGSVKKRKGSLVEEALGAIKTLSNQPMCENDSAEHFGVFVAARLREMNPETRKQCEHEIMKCLTNY